MPIQHIVYYVLACVHFGIIFEFRIWHHFHLKTVLNRHAVSREGRSQESNDRHRGLKYPPEGVLTLQWVIRSSRG